MKFELFEKLGSIVPGLGVTPSTRVTPAPPDRGQRHAGMTGFAGMLGHSILVIGGTVGGSLEAIALDAAIAAESREPVSLGAEPFNPAPANPALVLGSMLPDDTIATVIVDTMGDWQDLNQFDLWPQPIQGLSTFPYIPQLTDSDIATTVDDWSGDQIALAWLESDRVEQGSYGLTIVPFAADRTRAATQAQDYRTAIAAEWSSAGALADTQTYRGIDILALHELPPEELEPYGNPPNFDFNVDQPSAEAASPATKQATAVDQPDPIAAPEPPIDPTTPASVPAIRHAIAQLDDRLLFATSVDAITDYLDVLNLGDPVAVLPALTPLDPNRTLPSEAIAVDPVDHDAAVNPEPINPVGTALEAEPLRLSDVLAFREAIAREPEAAAAIVYADVPRLLQALGSLPLFATPMPDGTSVTPATTWNTSNMAIATLDGFLWFEPSGARLQFRSHYTEPQPQIAALARVDDETLGHIPAASALTMTTRGFDVILPEILAVYDAIPELQAPLNQGRDAIRNALGLDFDTDIVPLLDGDLSLFIFPVDRGLTSSIAFAPLGLGMTIETSDRPKMEALLTQLENLWREIAPSPTIKPSGLTVTEVEGFEVVSWNVPSLLNDVMSLMSHTWVSDDTLLITAGVDLMADLLPTPYQSLLDSYTYQSAIEPFPQPNISLFHVNVGSVLSLLNAYIPVSVVSPSGDQLDVARIVRSFRSISESTTATEDYAQDDIHIQLAPRRSE